MVKGLLLFAGPKRRAYFLDLDDGHSFKRKEARQLKCVDDNLLNVIYTHEEGCIHGKKIVKKGEKEEPEVVYPSCTRTVRGHVGRIQSADSFLLNLWNWLFGLLLSRNPGHDEDESIIMGLREWPFKLRFNPRYLCVRHESSIRSAKAKYCGTNGDEEENELLGAKGTSQVSGGHQDYRSPSREARILGFASYGYVFFF